MQIKLMAGAAVLALVLPMAAYAQSSVAVEPGTGNVVGVITETNMPRFREYVVREHHPSYRYDREVVVGAELPQAGVTYWEVPREYGPTEYRYTILNDRTVLVDPKTRRIIQIIG